MLDEISFLVQETFKYAENLKKDHKNILKHPNMFPALRLSQTEEEISEELSYFGVSSFEQAQKIREQIGNKRFPINEEHIFNLSDPGDTWWLESTDSSFNFYFNLAHVDRIESLTKLGPLGDSKSCLEFFGQLHGYFKQIFPLDKYSCGQGQVSVQAKDNTSLMFRYILDAFRSGEINTELREYLTSLEENSPNFEVRSSFQKANIFLSDLIVTRKFWKLIESKL